MNFIKQKIQPRHIWTWSKANKNIVFFVSGFLFDVFTIKRIDAIGDLAIQIVYLMGLTGLLFYQYRAHRDRWTPGPWVSKVWEHNTEALHFMYGGLFSAYVILYFKSTSGVRAVFFIFLLVLLLVSNEMPQVKRMGFRLRLGLYAFCVTSFFIYFVPILMGRMNAWIFLLSIFISAVLVWFVAGLLVFNEPEKRKSQIRLYMPAACLFLTVLVLYFMKLIPPVPLSVQYQGIFHMVMRNENNFTLTYLKPPWYDFWTNDSTPFLYHPGDKLNYFVRVYAPVRFKHEVMVRWSYFDEKKDNFVSTDFLPLEITGGRDQGFRGVLTKKNITAGRWRVSAETGDGRIIGYRDFKVIEDPGKETRAWRQLEM